MYYGGGLDTSLVSISNDTITSLPLQYGDTWQTVTADTQIIVPDFYYTVNTDTTLNTIDGWGTVRLPYGDFECLRLRIDEKSTNVAVSNGIAVTLSSESTIQYHWLTKGAFEVAWVQSQPGETDPNFTNAYGWGRLESMGPTTTVRNMTEVPDEISLLQNYPNPFNPATRIAFDLPESAPVKLEIFTILGQKVRSLVNTNMAPGQHIVSWDARDEMGRLVSGGFYIYRLEAGNTVKTRKMLYLK